MSIQRRQRKKGQVYVVHYYDTDAKKYRNKTFSRRNDAVAFESMVNLAKRRGDLAELDAGQETLSVFLGEWWSRHGDRFLAVNTQKAYEDLQKRFLTKHLGDLPLRRISPSAIIDMRDEIIDSSGDETARKTVAFLQGVLERAVEWERIRINPAKAVKKPAQSRQSRPRPLDPLGIERVAGGVADGQHRILIYLLGYAGLRPGEALALEWDDVTGGTLSVSKSVSRGVVGRTKTGHSRIVRLLAPLHEDLNRFRLASGSRTGRLVSRKDGGPWTDYDYRNWRRRQFATAVHGKPDPELLGTSEPGLDEQHDSGADGGITGDVPGSPERIRPYDLRHSFASLLFHEGRSPAYIAEQMGHSIQTLLSTYIHVIEELRDAEREDAESLIRAARVPGATRAVAESGA